MDSVPLTPTLAFLSGLRLILARSISKWCSIAIERWLHSWAVIYRLHDHVNVPCPVVSPPNREKPGHFHATDGDGYTPFFLSSHRANKAAQRIEYASIHTSARTSSLVEVRCTEARLLTRCHRITGGYFPDVDLLRECHRPPAPELDEKLRKNASVVAATRALTDTTGAHRFWRYERLLTMTLQVQKEYRSDAKFKRYRVHSPRLQKRNFGACPMRLSACCYFCVII